MENQKKRLCLFAGFDAKGEIAEYVVCYLKALARIADVYYWGDFDASKSEKAKIAPFCKAVYCEKHGKYDFGSWQELIQKIGRAKIAAYDEVILANDSCYGPLFDLKKLFAEMGKRDCDFWGLSAAYNNHVHLQSYFIVLKNQVLQSDVLYDFFAKVKPEANYCDVCEAYEDRFTYTLSKAGFKFCSYINYGDMANHPYVDIESAIKNRQFPFLKVKFFLGGIRDQAGVDDWRAMLTENTKYPAKLIEDDLARRGFDLAEIDQAVRNKKSEAYAPSKIAIMKRVIRKGLKIMLRPVLVATDIYFKRYTAPHAYRIHHLNRSYRQLQQQYDELRAQVDENFVPKEFKLIDKNKAYNLKLTGADASLIKRFDLELPLASDSEALLIGNIGTHNLDALELYNLQTVFLNNDWNTNPHIHSSQTKDLCNFNFVDELGKQVYFDFIFVQPLIKTASNHDLKHFIANLKRQMVFESVLVLYATKDLAPKYKQMLQDAGLHPASSEHGLVVRDNPFQVYYDKFKSVKGYEALIYKIKQYD